MLIVRVLSLVLSSVSLCVLAGCPTGSKIGTPCEDTGEEECEAEQRIRCDGKVWVLLAECHNTCIEDLEPVKHADAINSDETWTCVEGPHVVQETLTVGAGSTLSIQAGALVRIVAAARINTDLTGRIDSKGTINAPVLVTSDSGNASGFGGASEGGLNVFAVDGGDPSIIQFTIIERGIHGLGVFGLSSETTPPIVENNTFRDNTNYGIVISCNEVDPPLPDFAGEGQNRFLNNGAGEVAPCP